MGLRKPRPFLDVRRGPLEPDRWIEAYRRRASPLSLCQTRQDAAHLVPLGGASVHGRVRCIRELVLTSVEVSGDHAGRPLARRSPCLSEVVVSFVANAASSAPSSVVTIDPVRILDTRDPSGIGLPGPFVSAVPQKLQVTGGSVPSGATGALLNVTVVEPTASGIPVGTSRRRHRCALDVVVELQRGRDRPELGAGRTADDGCRCRQDRDHVRRVRRLGPDHGSADRRRRLHGAQC